MGYDKVFADALQFAWGEGFLSPGGAAEIRDLLADNSLTGQRVLDIGSGLGGVDLLLVTEHGAAHVTGIDVDSRLVASAKDLVRRHGLGDRITFSTVTPGPLPFADSSFDAVFSKDAMIHIHDKPSIYAEVLRVLKPGGRFIASDWLFSEGAAESSSIHEWLEDNPLGFAFTTPLEAEAALQRAGFADVRIRDRSAALTDVFAAESLRLAGGAQAELAQLVGTELAADRALGARQRLAAIRSGDFRPSHLGGTRPATIA